jgi:DNA-binding MarR family transcriptional regulator
MNRKSADVNLQTTPQGGLEPGGMQALLGYAMAQASIVTNDCFDRVVRQPLDLRKVEFTILQLVCKSAAVTPGRLAKALAFTAPGVTVWLDRLVARGLVKRERSETDRRAQNLSATDAGQALVAQALADLLAAEQAALAVLSAGERQILLELLHKAARTRHR